MLIRLDEHVSLTQFKGLKNCEAIRHSRSLGLKDGQSVW